MELTDRSKENLSDVYSRRRQSSTSLNPPHESPEIPIVNNDVNETSSNDSTSNEECEPLSDNNMGPCIFSDESSEDMELTNRIEKYSLEACRARVIFPVWMD
ncbi:unnamed protein product [Lepeophtheirus salmonis]|uniref:(salmon louse) hypothetical protein n=1 Tax=Lepeophtheirus salmonis TaxID=72036 RepID=A0A7R8H1D4_LEPSM|nr:unnamed protein product [Lepeophtheirus salmonis]CAF2807275.1 unnamed protein product [Lepeophtheirus salmonis]